MRRPAPPTRHSRKGSNPEGQWRPFALREIEGGTGARRGMLTAAPPSENRTQPITVGAVREPPVPRERDPPHHHPHPHPVVHTKAGTQQDQGFLPVPRPFW